MEQREPVVSARMHPFARRILDMAKRIEGAGDLILGGYFALQHYLDYRETRDVDFWWEGRRSEAGWAAVRTAMQSLARETGMAVKDESRPAVDSLALVAADGKPVFKCQAAVRDRFLKAPLPGPYPPIRIESLEDNIAAKMTALVLRGAPRDFRDVREICGAIATMDECWDLWSRANPGFTRTEAALAAARHLEALEGRRPLESIASPEERAKAAALRGWFRKELGRETRLS